jgi:hypothetical protein
MSGRNTHVTTAPGKQLLDSLTVSSIWIMASRHQLAEDDLENIVELLESIKGYLEMEIHERHASEDPLAEREA